MVLVPQGTPIDTLHTQRWRLYIISVKVGNGELETTNSYRSQFSIAEITIRSSSMKSKSSSAMAFVTWAMANAGIAQ